MKSGRLLILSVPISNPLTLTTIGAKHSSLMDFLLDITFHIF